MKAYFICTVLILMFTRTTFACKELWDSTCQNDNDCCSAFCDNNNGQWAFGICKQSIIVTKSDGSKMKKGKCKWDWDNTCHSQDDCCSGFCDNNNGKWRYGICKPPVIGVVEETNTNKTCYPDWNAKCRANDDCCSKTCQKASNGWEYGICKPAPTTISATTMTMTTVTTSESEVGSMDNSTHVCHKDWYDKCRKNIDCCSNNCYDNNGKWPTGICKPGKPTKKPIEDTAEIDDAQTENTTRSYESTTIPMKIDYKDISCNEMFRLKMLSLHNRYRKKHMALDFKISKKLEGIAKSYSEMLLREDIGLFHSRNRRWGENLGRFSGENCQHMAESIFQKWYSENENFDYEMGEYSSKTADFTQIVWKASTRIGCGISCIEKNCYAACNYSPGGNMGGLYRKNVSPNQNGVIKIKW